MSQEEKKKSFATDRYIGRGWGRGGGVGDGYRDKGWMSVLPFDFNFVFAFMDLWSYLYMCVHVRQAQWYAQLG